MQDQCDIGSPSRLNGRSRRVGTSSHLAWWILTLAGVLVLGLGLLATSEFAKKAARRVAGRFEAEEPAPAGIPAELRR